MTDARALTGVRVVAVEQFGAGPWATLQLAALGAEIIKIEDPSAGGDVGRYVGPFNTGENSLFFETFNRGKHSISLDLRRPEARNVLHDLVRQSDALFCNLRGDLPARLGLNYAALSETNPSIVCCSLSGFGSGGPRAAQGAYDYVIQGYAGWMSLTGEPDGPPTRTGLSLVDFSGGFVAAISLLAGLLRARETGIGCDCDVSLFEVALALNTYVATWALSAGWQPTRMPSSAHPSVVPFQLFPSQDGWIVICCAKESLFQKLCHAVDLGWMLDDPRFATLAARDRHRDECVEIISRRLRTNSTAAWIDLLQGVGVPCGPVNDVRSAFDDPQAIARDVVEEYEHEQLGPVRAARVPVNAGQTAKLTRAPYRGEQTRIVLQSLCGYSVQELDELAAAGVFGESDRTEREEESV